VKSSFIYLEKAAEFSLGPGHPYRLERVRMAYDTMNRYGLLSGDGREVARPSPAGMEDLAEVHTARYLELLELAGRGEVTVEALSHGIGTEDCPAFPGLMEFAKAAAGATIEAGRKVTDEGFDFAFNPVGGFHHAGRDRAEGFCYVNDVALLARRWAEAGMKVMVLDIDAHHGNGTQDFFYQDPRVLTVSFHESTRGLFPFKGGGYEEIGSGEGRGFNLNVPMLESSDDETFLYAFEQLIPPLFEAFRPDAVIGLMGVDTHGRDPLTHLNMTNNSYMEAGLWINKLAPRWTALGAGGYNTENVVNGWTLLWAAVNGLLREEDEMATLGGTFMGEAELGVTSLRDMAARTSGPQKAEAIEAVEEAIGYLEKNALPLIGA